MITDGDLDVVLERAFKQGGGELFLRHSYLRWAKSFHAMEKVSLDHIYNTTF